MYRAYKVRGPNSLGCLDLLLSAPCVLDPLDIVCPLQMPVHPQFAWVLGWDCPQHASLTPSSLVRLLQCWTRQCLHLSPWPCAYLTPTDCSSECIYVHRRATAVEPTVSSLMLRSALPLYPSTPLPTAPLPLCPSIPNPLCPPLRSSTPPLACSFLYQFFKVNMDLLVEPHNFSLFSQVRRRCRLCRRG